MRESESPAFEHKSGWLGTAGTNKSFMIVTHDRWKYVICIGHQKERKKKKKDSSKLKKKIYSLIICLYSIYNKYGL